VLLVILQPYYSIKDLDKKATVETAEEVVEAVMGSCLKGFDLHFVVELETVQSITIEIKPQRVKIKMYTTLILTYVGTYYVC